MYEKRLQKSTGSFAMYFNNFKSFKIILIFINFESLEFLLFQNGKLQKMKIV